MEQRIGMNAGDVWRYLKDNGATSPSKLSKELNLKESDLHRAVGWLSREGKIHEVQNGKSTLLDLSD